MKTIGSLIRGAVKAVLIFGFITFACGVGCAGCVAVVI